MINESKVVENKKITSVDEFNEYIKICRPRIWIILFALILLIVSLSFWGIWGKIETTIDKEAVVKNGSVYCFLDQDDKLKVANGVTVKINSKIYYDLNVSNKAITYDEAESIIKNNDMDLNFNLSIDKLYYIATLKTDNVPDGLAYVSIIVESISPISFLMGQNGV